jgi:hypothetical protein
VSDLELDQLLGDTAEPGERMRVRAHLEACVRCGERASTLLRQRAAFLERMPSWQALRAQHSASLPVERPRRLARVWRGRVLAAVAATVGVMILSLTGPESRTELRRKGGPRLGAYIKRGEHVTRAEDGARVRPGDFVRFTYSSERPLHFALFNRDAQRASTYFPEQGSTTSLVAAGRDVALDFSIRLDEQLGQERVYGLFCAKPQALAPLRAALQNTGELPQLPDCRVDVLTLDKHSE